MSIFDVIPVTVADYRRRAEWILPRFLFDYADGGANDELTLKRNVEDFARIQLRQRVLHDVSALDTSTTLLGQSASMPLALAPVGMAGMYARRGELQAAAAAHRVGVPFTASTAAICSIDEINGQNTAPAWFQLYMLRDRALVQEMLKRAWNSGSRTLVFTVDLPIAGMRLRDFRNGMLGGGLPGKLSKLAQLASSPLWAWDVGIKGKPHSFGNLASSVTNPNDLEEYATFVGSQFDPTVTWEDIRWLRDQWQGQLLIKGVMEADDARAAIDCGAEGVVVSNHGGRQLDSVSSTIAKLPDVVAALDGRAEVFVDGGVRSGIDVVKAVALGARGVLIGRAWLFAMSARGEQGVYDLLSLFRREISTALALMGVNQISELSPDLLDR